MKYIRTYGNEPFKIVTVHGGPGAAGDMAAVARELAKKHSVLEPLQTADSVEGQVHELKGVLETHAALPVILIGHSWGTWLSWIVAAKHPELVKKLILIASGPFEPSYAKQIQQTRLGRFTDDERADFEAILNRLNKSTGNDNNRLLAKLGSLCSQADAYDPIHGEQDHVKTNGDIFRNVWPQADRLRNSGELLDLAAMIRCPVTAIHGDHDPHPADGVQRPLHARLKNFRFILLEKCGHKPWIERQAKKQFYDLLERELD